MSSQELLTRYKNHILRLSSRAKYYQIPNKQIKTMLKSSIHSFEKNNCSNHTNRTWRKVPKLFIYLIILSIAVNILLYVHQPTCSYVLRNVQGFIYPGMKLIRYLAIPIISIIPALTGLYDESCLIENPNFYVDDMECWPCENVHSVMDITGLLNLSSYKAGNPYIAKINQTIVQLPDIQYLITANLNTFENDLCTLKSNNPKLSSLSSLLNFTPTDGKSHVSVRINRMNSARILRGLFPRPPVMTEWSGQSIERFVMFDEAEANSYFLPKFECSFVFVIQAAGEIIIILKPTGECKERCKTVSILLKPSYILWYNWWYWRPISLPKENSTESSISYISSYC